MLIRKIAETSNPPTITLGWDPVPGCEGYLFYKDGIRVSRSFDPLKNRIKFSKPGVYRVEAITFATMDSGTYPTSPPPAHVVVAPRVAYEQLGSDARYCLFVNQDDTGDLRPGLSYVPGTNNQYVRDQIAVYRVDGLCEGSERTGGSVQDGIVGSREIDGRPLCSLPMPGDPLQNTGSWKI